MSEVILYDALAIESKMKLEAARLNIQNILDSVSAIHWTEENINEDLLAPARNAVSQLKDFKDKGKRPHLDANAAYETAFKEVSTLIIEAATKKSNEKKVLATKIEAERAKIDAENRRLSEIKAHITSFITDSTASVTKATTAPEIAKIEMSIGSQLSRKAYFGDFYDEFVEKIAPIRELISSRKKLLAERNKLETKREDAEGAELADIVEQKEDLSIGLIQNQVELYDAVEKSSQFNTYVGQSTAPEVIPSRRQWKFEVTDIKTLHTKHPELVTLEANDAAIRVLISKYRTEGQLKDGIDINLPGLRIYQDKIYK